MARRHDFRIAKVGENIPFPDGRQLFIQAVDVAHAAAEDDDVGIEQVDGAGKAAGQTVGIAGQGVTGDAFPLAGIRDDVVGRKILAP